MNERQSSRSRPTGDVILVTGGSRGIGAATAEALATAGARVAINYVNASGPAAALAERIGNGASTWPADIRDERQAQEMVAAVVRHYGRLDGLVLNAGVWHGGPISDVGDAERNEVIATALDSAFHLIPAALPQLRDNGGRIVVVSSVIGMVGFPGDSVYATAKAGQIGLVRALAKEFGPYGITVNAVAPGLINTDMTAAISDRARSRMLSRVPLGVTGDPGDVALAVRFLLLDAHYVTGHVLVVDGGFGL